MTQTISQLADQLRNGDEEAQKAAAIALGKTGHPEAALPLIEALHNEKRSVRKAAHECLIQLRDDRAVQPLIDAAADGRLDFNPVAYSLERKFGVEDAYPRTLAAVEAKNKPDVLEKARQAYALWEKRQH